MLTRVSSVLISILTAVWLARSPDWEPLIAFVASLSTYIGIEVSQQKSRKKAKEEPQVPPTQPESKEKTKDTPVEVISSISTPKRSEKLEDERCRKILRFMAKKSDGSTSPHTAFKLGISVDQVEYFQDVLLEHKFIKPYGKLGNVARYIVTATGRSYLFDEKK